MKLFKPYSVEAIMQSAMWAISSGRLDMLFSNVGARWILLRVGSDPTIEPDSNVTLTWAYEDAKSVGASKQSMMKNPLTYEREVATQPRYQPF